MEEPMAELLKNGHFTVDFTDSHKLEHPETIIEVGVLVAHDYSGLWPLEGPMLVFPGLPDHALSEQ
jgi:hypothetical protein